jgi:hypothetical protein
LPVSLTIEAAFINKPIINASAFSAGSKKETMEIKTSIKQIAQDAQLASRILARVSSAEKNNALLLMADELEQKRNFLLA